MTEQNSVEPAEIYQAITLDGSGPSLNHYVQLTLHDRVQCLQTPI